jgi:phage protein U
MLVGLGTFRFHVPTTTVDTLNRTVSGRVANQAVIGAAPRTHLLGPDTETISISSKFYPMNYNIGGEQLMAGLRAVCAAQIPMMMVASSGRVFGRWIIVSVTENETRFGPSGRAQEIDATLELQAYVGRTQVAGLF